MSKKKEVFMEEDMDMYSIHGKVVKVVTLEKLRKEKEDRIDEEVAWAKRNVIINKKNRKNGVQLTALQFRDMENALNDFQGVDWTMRITGSIGFDKFNFRNYDIMIDELKNILNYMRDNKGTKEIVIDQKNGKKVNISMSYFPEETENYVMFGYIGHGKAQTSKIDPAAFPRGFYSANGMGQYVRMFLSTLTNLNNMKSDEERYEYLQGTLKGAQILFRYLPDVINEDRTLFPYLYLDGNQNWDQLYVQVSHMRSLLRRVMGDNGTYYMFIHSMPTYRDWNVNVKTKYTYPNGINPNPEATNFCFHRAIYMDVFGHMCYGIIAGNKSFGDDVLLGLLQRDILKKTFHFFNDLPVHSGQDVPAMKKRIQTVKQLRNIIQETDTKFREKFLEVVQNHGKALIEGVDAVAKIVDGQILQTQQLKENVVLPLPQPTNITTLVPMEEEREKVVHKYMTLEEENKIPEEQLPRMKPLPKGAQIYIGQDVLEQGELREEKKPVAPRSVTDGVNVVRTSARKPAVRPVKASTVKPAVKPISTIKK